MEYNIVYSWIPGRYLTELADKLYTYKIYHEITVFLLFLFKCILLV